MARSQNVPIDQESDLTPRQAAYLEAFVECARHGRAAEAAGVDRRSALRWRDSEPFKSAFLEAKRAAVLFLEDEAVRQASDPEKPSPTVLCRLLEAWGGPEWRQKKEIQHSGEVAHRAKLYVFEGELTPEEELD